MSDTIGHEQCVTCALPVEPHDDAFLIVFGLTNRVACLGFSHHLLPVVVDGINVCPGYPPIAQYVEGQPRCDDPSVEFLPKLTGVVRELRATLLSACQPGDAYSPHYGTATQHNSGLAAVALEDICQACGGAVRMPDNARVVAAMVHDDPAQANLPALHLEARRLSDGTVCPGFPKLARYLEGASQPKLGATPYVAELERSVRAARKFLTQLAESAFEAVDQHQRQQHMRATAPLN